MVLTARRGFATVVVLALLLASFLGVSWARGNKGVGRSAAARAALRALGARTHTGPEIVFGLRSPVPAGTVVRAGGPSRPAVGVSAVSSRAPTVARTSGA